MTSPTIASPFLSAPAKAGFSLVRLYALRCGYLLLAVGLAVVVWPSVLVHTSEFAVRAGAQMSLLAGIGAMALLGLRYPVKMLPLLLFEVTWKTIYLVAFALPLWMKHQVNAQAASDIAACLMVVIFIPIIPWGFVFRQYGLQRGERWR